jgi:hypothetical protein
LDRAEELLHVSGTVRQTLQHFRAIIVQDLTFADTPCLAIPAQNLLAGLVNEWLCDKLRSAQRQHGGCEAQRPISARIWRDFIMTQMVWSTIDETRLQL